nr:MAG TPA: hypothetical protein [Caudoviricetes sp.]
MRLEKIDDTTKLNMDLILSIRHVNAEYIFHLISGSSYTINEKELNPVMKQYLVGII